MTEVREKKRLYRSRRGIFLGVCRGIAEHFGFSVFWFRVLVVIAVLVTGVWPLLGLYILLALIMKPEPAVQPRDEGEEEFYGSYASSRPMAVHRLKRKYDSLDRRIRRLEDVVTSKEYDWNRRLAGR